MPTFARRSRKRIGGDISAPRRSYGKREFVEGPLPVRRRARHAGDRRQRGRRRDRADERAGRSRSRSAARASPSPRARSTACASTAATGTDTFAIEDRAARAEGRRRPRPDRRRRSRRRRDRHAPRRDALTSATSPPPTCSRSTPTPSGTTAYGSEDDDQISLGSFGLLGPTFIQLVNPSLDRYLTVDGRGGDDIISASVGRGRPHARRRRRRQRPDRRPRQRPPDRRRRLRRRQRRQGRGRRVARRRLRPLQLEAGRRQRRRRRRREPRLALASGHQRRRGVRAGARRPRAAVDTRSANVALALAGVEEIDPVLGGGEDTFAIGDLSPHRRAARRHLPRVAADHAARRLQRRPRSRSPAPTGRRAEAHGQGRRRPAPRR